VNNILFEVFNKALNSNVSDIILINSSSPMYRVDGILYPVSDFPPLTSSLASCIYELLSEDQRKRLETERVLDFAVDFSTARLRINVFFQKSSLAAVVRIIPSVVPTFKYLNLPSVVEEFTSESSGLFLVTGPTGSGKSTTLAAIINKVNTQEQTRQHIITIEDPIEFVHQNDYCVVSQRQIGRDARAFPEALESVLRENPDIVMVGETRDAETLTATLRVAETGHLTLATLHTDSAVATISRILDMVPPQQQEQVRSQLASVLKGVLTQRLLPTIDGGRVPACEVLLVSTAVKNLIRENKIHQISAAMAASGDRYAMQTFNQSLCSLYDRGKITIDTAVAFSPNRDELHNMLKKVA
jgi:twitching motility protein PilT